MGKIIFNRKIARDGTSQVVSIPPPILAALELDHGDPVTLEIEENAVIIRKVPP